MNYTLVDSPLTPYSTSSFENTIQSAEILLNSTRLLGDQDMATLRASIADAKQRMLDLRDAASDTLGTITDLASKIAALEAENPLVLEQYLLSQINSLGEQFARDALALKGAFIQLAGLEEMLHSATASKREIIPFRLTLPLPKLAVCKSIWPNAQPDLLFTTRSPEAMQERAAWIAAERERLAGVGLEIL